jgi:predicted metal-dependent hydrolase
MDPVTDAEDFDRGRDLFNRGRFFDAHEAWEKLWLRAHGARRLFLQGLIQIAAGCHKAYERGDRRGCAALVSAGLEKISREGLPTELSEFSERLDGLITRMRAREAASEELPPVPALPEASGSPGVPPGVTGATPEDFPRA